MFSLHYISASLFKGIHWSKYSALVLPNWSITNSYIYYRINPFEMNLVLYFIIMLTVLKKIMCYTITCPLTLSTFLFCPYSLPSSKYFFFSEEHFLQTSRSMVPTFLLVYSLPWCFIWYACGTHAPGISLIMYYNLHHSFILLHIYFSHSLNKYYSPIFIISTS